MWALQGPRPLTATSSAITSSSGSSSRRSSSSEPSITCSASERRNGTFAWRQAGGRAQLLGVVREHLDRRRRCGRRSGRSAVRRSRARRSSRAAGRRSSAPARRSGRPGGPRRGSPRPSTPISSISVAQHGVGARGGARPGRLRSASARGGGLRLAGNDPGDAGVGRVLGLDLGVGADLVDRLGDRDRRLGEAGRDQLELAVEGGDVAARPDALERRSSSPGRRRSRP